MKWIPTKDRLPDKGKYVLIYIKDYMVTKARLYESWQNESGYTYYERDLVTYWMPLPEPPTI